MRVLILSQFYPPTLGGVEGHVAALASGLRRLGHEVAVGTFRTPERAEPAEEDGVTVHPLGGLAQRMGALHATERRHAPPVPDPETVRDLRAVVESFRPDVVHAHNWLGRSFLPLKKRSGARFVVTLHDCGRACAQGRMMYRGETLCPGAGLRGCARCTLAYFGPLKGLLTLEGNEFGRALETPLVDLYLPVSTAVADANRLAEAGVPYEVVPNFAGEPPARTPQDTPGLDTLPAQPFILQVGDIVPDKGVHVLLEAYRRIGPPPPLVLAGRDPSRLAADPPPGVVVTGPLPPAAVAEAWRRSLFGTAPSLCLDASPTVTLEAMAAGRAVVASARGGLTDQVVDGRTGILVEPGDPDALAAAMRSLLADGAARERLGAAGRARFESVFRSDVVVARIAALYDELLGASTRARSATTGR